MAMVVPPPKPTPPKPVALPVPKPLNLVPQIPTPSVLLLGAPGTGKTDVLIDLINHGLELFVISTEPNGVDTLLDSVHRRKADIKKLHWKQIQPFTGDFEDMLKTADKTGTMQFEGITKMVGTKPKRSQFYELLLTLTDFQCDRTGECFGPVDKFSPNRAVAMDSLSGLNLLSMTHVTGDKPVAHIGEWGLAMGQIENLINRLCGSLKCTFVLIGHLEREADEQTGGATKLMASTLGRRLAPKLPRFFSEVVMAYRAEGKWYWATDYINVDLKHRALPLGSKLEPSFLPIVQAYHRRLAQVQGNLPKT
jgi:AAA domain